VSHVLIVATRQLCDPVAHFVDPEAGDLSFHASPSSWWPTAPACAGRGG